MGGRLPNCLGIKVYCVKGGRGDGGYYTCGLTGSKRAYALSSGREERERVSSEDVEVWGKLNPRKLVGVGSMAPVGQS